MNIPLKTGAKKAFSETSTHVLDIEQWIKQRIADRVKRRVEEIKIESSLTRHGLDSTKVMTLAHDIEEEFSIQIPETFFFEIESIKDLVEGIKRLAADNRSKPVESFATAEFVPLTPAQNRLWFINRIIEDKHLYNIPVAIKISGNLDRALLIRCIETIRDRHHLLRARFIEKEGIVRYYLDVDQKMPIEEVDLSFLAAAQKKAELHRIQQEKSRAILDLESGPCWSSTLVTLDDRTHYLIVVIHHIIADGWSLKVFIDEIRQLYPSDGQTLSEIPALEAQYGDVVRQIALPTSESLDYWKSLVRDDEPINLPLDGNRPSVQSFRGRRFPLRISKKLAESIRVHARNEGVTPFALLMTVFKVLLHRYSNQEQIKVGMAVANRESSESAKLIGLFMDSVLVASNLDNSSFNDHLQRVYKNLKTSILHKNVSMIDIVKSLNLGRDLSRSPLFQVMFIFQDTIMEPTEVGELVFTPQVIDHNTSKFDLTLELYQGQNGIEGWFEYNSDLFSEATISRMGTHFSILLESALGNPGLSVGDLTIHSREEQVEIVEGIDQADSGLENNPLLPRLFAHQAAKTPERTALVFKDETFTYQALNEKANTLAHYLIDLDLPANSPVGVYLDRNASLVPTILAVLKAGFAFVPIDPIYPTERINYMLNDAGIRAVISNQKLAGEITLDQGTIIELDTVQNDIAQKSKADPRIEVNRSGIAYIIYTSGSTGNPKGVVISHGALANFLCSMAERPGMTEHDTLLAVTTISFDISILELFLPLTVGANVVLASGEDTYSGRSLINLLDNEQHPVTIMQATPSTWKMLIQSGWSKSPIKALCGGEALPKSLANEILERCDSLWNMYGPTETTIWSSVAEIEKGFQNVVIGSPIANTSFVIVNEKNKIVPRGVPGELCIGGKGLAQGYFKRPRLTDEKFIPFAFQGRKTRIYKTGDLVRYNAEGALEIIGRMDGQVKIRGYRVELGEIESLVKADQRIRDCVVVAKQVIQSEASLVCYYISEPSINISEFKTNLRKKLPDYMIPSYFVPLETFPTTPAGKTDKKNLPLPVLKNATEKIDFPVGERNDIETVILNQWKKVLEREDITSEQNFFDVGGHSLLLGKLQAALEKALTIDIKLLDLLKYTNVKSQAVFFLNQQPGLLPRQKSPKPQPVEDDIAVIGISCRVPGARNQFEFWDNLKNARESITRFSREELSERGIDAAVYGQKEYVNAWGTLENIEQFDADFFGYTPHEAELIDPQQRIFLEECYKTLEDGGYALSKENSRIGLFAGMGMNTYLAGLNDPVGPEKLATNYQRMISNDKDFLTTRVAYKLNLKGPALSVQTACSTSLVAVHLACQCLQKGEADLALAGGVSVRIPQDSGYLYQEGMILSADGHCRAFDEASTGTVGANGAGVVLLKPLQKAIDDDDHIYAVIKGSAINNDGLDKIGYTAPSLHGQADVIHEALQKAQVGAEEISFIEAHGTGTKLGDPIEIDALKTVFAPKTSKKNYCAIGSVKTNIGHLDCAAGVVGLIKSCLSLDHGCIPPSLHFKNPNPKIDFKNSPFYVNTELKHWPEKAIPMRCGVSSFGIGGTNAHVVIEQYQKPNRTVSEEKEAGTEILPFSAKSETSLGLMNEAIAHFLKNESQTRLSDIAFTLQTRRKAYSHRSFVIADSKASAVQSMLNDRSLAYSKNGAHSDPEKLIFLFPGQGTQFVKMAGGLYQHTTGFRSYLDRCASIIKRYGNFDLRELLFPEKDVNPGSIHQTNITQPLLFSVEYALAKFLSSLGLKPSAMLGHSLGEYVCACIANVFSLEDALKTVVFRANLMSKAKPGSMLAVFENEKTLQALLGSDLPIAVVNAPNMTVLSAPDEEIDAYKNVLENQAILCKPLATSHAFHSKMMDPILAEYKEFLDGITLSGPTIPYVSNVTGAWITDSEATSSDYWVSQLRGKVRISNGLQLLNGLENHCYLELGPGYSMKSFVQQQNKQKTVHPMLGDSKGKDNDWQLFLSSMGKLWRNGQTPDWNALKGPQHSNRVVPLPPYAFEKNRFWKAGPQKPLQTGATDDQRKALPDWFYIPSWKRSPIVKGAGIKEPNHILCLVNEAGVSKKIAGGLKNKPVVVTTGLTGNQNHHDQNSFNLCSGSQEDYEALFKWLVEEDRFPDQIIHALNFGEVGGLEEQKNRAFFSLLYTSQALARYGTREKVELIVLSSNTQQITGLDTIHPLKALVTGPIRVIGQEYPNVKCRNIDFLAVDGQVSDDWVTQTLDEMEQGNESQFTAYRGIYRWTREFERISLKTPLPNVPIIKKNGLYLITGGTGDLGLLTANYISSQTQARIILVGTSPFPERDTWESLSAFESVQSKIERIREIESTGSKVTVLTMDISKREELFTSLDSVENQWGAINGVFHLAGVAGDGLIPFKSKEKVESVLAPKVDGTLWLDEYFRDKTLDFLILYSSITSILGGPGQIDYTSANAFLDAFALQAQNRNVPVHSINWDTWNEIGMAVKSSTGILNESMTKPIKRDHPFRFHHQPVQQNRDRYFCLLSADDWVFSEHLILENPTLPGTVYIEMLAVILKDKYPDQTFEVENLYFLTPLVTDKREQIEVCVDIQPSDSKLQFKITSKTTTSHATVSHAEGSAVLLRNDGKRLVDISGIKKRCRQREISNPENFAHLARISSLESQNIANQQVRFGPRWKNISQIDLGDKEGLALMKLPAEYHSDLKEYDLHPALFDCAVAFLRIFQFEGIFLPFSYHGLKIHASLPAAFYSHMQVIEEVKGPHQKGMINFSVLFFDEEGRLLLEVDRFTMREIDQNTLDRSARLTKKPLQNPFIRLQQKLIEGGIKNQEGENVLDWMLHNPLEQVIVSTHDLRYRLDQFDKIHEKTAEHRDEDSAKETYPRPNLAVAYVPPTGEMEIKITDIWKRLLGINEVGIQDDIFDLGAHSLLIVEFFQELKDIVTKEISVVDLYEHTTTESLVQFLAQGKKAETSLENVKSRAQQKKQARSKRKAMSKNRREKK